MAISHPRPIPGEDRYKVLCLDFEHDEVKEWEGVYHHAMQLVTALCCESNMFAILVTGADSGEVLEAIESNCEPSVFTV